MCTILIKLFCFYSLKIVIVYQIKILPHFVKDSQQGKMLSNLPKKDCETQLGM